MWTKEETTSDFQDYLAGVSLQPIQRLRTAKRILPLPNPLKGFAQENIIGSLIILSGLALIGVTHMILKVPAFSMEWIRELWRSSISAESVFPTSPSKPTSHRVRSLRFVTLTSREGV